MPFKTNPLASYLVAFAFIFFNFGCTGNKANTSNFGSVAVPITSTPGTTPATPPGPPSAPAGSSNGIMSDDYFYVGIETTNDAIAHVHKVGDFSAPCAVNKTATTNEDITCIVDIPEADLYAKDLEFKYNVPAGGMCRYLARYPYYFYNYEVGVGPEVVVATTTIIRNASNDITGVTHNCVVDGTPYANCAGMPELTANTSQSGVSFSCVYDGTPSRPNCCSGSYEITNNIVDTVSTTSTTTGTWGGLSNDCYGGTGNVNPLKATGGGTVGARSGILEFSKNGLKDVYKTTAPGLLPRIPKADVASLHVANYYKANVHTHTGFVLNTIPNDQTDRPYFLDPVDDRSGSPISRTNNAYTFICYNEAYEINHRIKVFVRDWDTYPNYLAYISSQGVTETPDSSAFAETDPNCEGVSGPCDDFYDLDDFLGLNLILQGVIPGPFYDTTDITKRTHYFPKIIY